MKSALSAGLALASCMAFAAVDKQTFDDDTSVPSNWTGDVALASARDGKVLAVDGEATCANAAGATDSQWAKSSFIVKTPEDGVDTADLPTAATESEKMTGCQIAVATGPAITEGENAGKLKVMVYCGATPAWTETTAAVAKSTESAPVWMSVDIDCDYAAGKAEVFVNGTSAGSYALASGTIAKSKVASLLFVGSSQIDDVAIAETDAVPADVLPEAIKTLPSIDLAAQGITLADIVENATVGESGLTVQEKLECGLDPTDDSTFTAKAIAPAAKAGDVAVVVPYAFNNGQKYTVVMTDEDGTTTETLIDTPALDAKNKTATLTITPTAGKKVLKFSVKAAAPAPAAK